MASKKPAKPAGTAATGAPKKPRVKSQPSMTTAQKFDLLSYVKNADRTLPDASVADDASRKFGRKVLPASVKAWRAEFGIPSVPKPSVEQLLRYIQTLQATLETNSLPVPPMEGAVVIEVKPDGATTVTELKAA